MQTLTFVPEQRPANGNKTKQVYVAEFVTSDINTLQFAAATDSRIPNKSSLDIYARIDADLPWVHVKSYIPLPSAFLQTFDIPAGLQVCIESSEPGISATVVTATAPSGGSSSSGSGITPEQMQQITAQVTAQFGPELSKAIEDANSAATDANQAAANANNKLTEITPKVEAAEGAATSASQSLADIRAEIMALVESGATDAAVVAKVALLLSRINAIGIIPTAEGGFFATDSEGNVLLKYDKDGLDAALVSEHLKTLLGGGSSITIGNVTGTAYDGGKGRQLETRLKNVEDISGASVFGNEYYLPVSVKSLTNRPNHDCTWVGDELWSFDKPSEGGLQIYDADLTRIKSVNTKIYYNRKDGQNVQLEMKSVDWNEEKQILMVGNGSASYTATDSYAFIFYSAKSWKNASGEINLSNCGDYTKIDLSELGGKCYAFFGPQPDIIFVSINLFKDVYLVRLGMGTNNLGHGTYTAASADKFNGTWERIKGWTCQGVGEFAAHGGQYYNGSLYLATNEDGKTDVYKCVLKDNGMMQFDVLHLNVLDNNGSLRYYEIDGLAIKEGVIYAQPLGKTSNGVSGAMLISKII